MPFGFPSKKDFGELLDANKKLKEEVDGLKADIAKSVPHWLLSRGEAEKWQMPDPSYYESQDTMYKKSSWVLSAAENTAKVAVPIPFNVKRKVGEEERDIPNHPFEILLNSPNDLDSRYNFLTATIITRIVNGNAYWWLNKPDSYSPPDEIWYIPPNRIIPVPDKKLYLEGYHYYPGNGEEILFPPDQVVHFKRFNPFSRFIGMSAVEALAYTVFGDMEMASWNARLFRENNGRLPGIITFEQFPPDDVWDIMKSDITEAARRRNFLMLRGVGAGGIQWLQNSVSQREMEFLEGRQANRNEIWDVLAPGLVSYLSPNATEANSRTGESAFERLSVNPILEEIAQQISNEVLRLWAGKLIGHFENIIKIDQQMENEKQKLYQDSHAVGEIRKTFYGDSPFGDERDKMSVEQFQKMGSTTAYAGNQNATSVTSKPEYTVTGTESPERALAQVQGKAALEELDKFERKAIRKLGKDVDFMSDHIPEDIQEFIHCQLPICLDEKALKAVFEQARIDVVKIPVIKLSNEKAMTLADAINNLADKLS